MIRYAIALSVLALVAVLSALAADEGAPGKKKPAAKKPRRKVPPVLAPIKDNPKLPRALLIGDSISVGYTLPARKLLKGKVNLHRIPFNGASTKQALKYLESALGEKKWDVIHFNWGLHDMKYINAKGQLADPKQGRQQVPIEQYEKNLKRLMKKLKATGAKLIWAATTPVPKGADGRIPGDAVKYNAAAAKIMKENGAAIDDLYSLVKPKLKEYQRPANVHFKPAGSQAMAKQVAKSILAALKRPTTLPGTARAANGAKKHREKK